MSERRHLAPGPFRAEHIRSGDPYELSNGHPILVAPTKHRGGEAQSIGASVVASDPAVEHPGTEVGFSPSPDTLRAPDVSVHATPPGDGWATEPPLLAIEYADSGQDWPELRLKIDELLRAGTPHVWVVRLDKVRHVEVYAPGRPMARFGPGDVLEAPGALANPVPVEALWDPEQARAVVLRNTLSRHGYADLDAVRSEGREEGREEGRLEGMRVALRAVLTGRGWSIDDVHERRIATAGRDALVDWLGRAGSAPSLEALLRPTD